MSSIPRVHLTARLTVGDHVTLDERARHHIVNVLRLKTGADLLIFNGEGGEFKARLFVSSKQATVELTSYCDINRESDLHLHLVQGISRGDRMDFAIQKAAELGVSRITPVFSRRSISKLEAGRLEKRLDHWRNVLIGACEQSGRCTLPVLETPLLLEHWLDQTAAEPNRYLLDPSADLSLNAVPRDATGMTLVIGPEGGFDRQELNYASSRNCLLIRFGPRILRTETAAIAAIAVLQALAGDLSR